MRRSLWLLSTLVLVALAGSCASGGDEALPPTATLGTAPTTTAAPAEPPPDPAVIPDDPADIDEDYVQAVVDALFAVDAKATEIFVTTREVGEEGIDYLEAILVPEELDRRIYIWEQSLAQRADNLLPGQLANEVEQVIDVSEDCVYLMVERDYSETTRREVGQQVIYLGLTPKLPAEDPKASNPTAWMLFMDGFNPDGSRPENPCEER